MLSKNNCPYKNAKMNLNRSYGNINMPTRIGAAWLIKL